MTESIIYRRIYVDPRDLSATRNSK